MPVLVDAHVHFHPSFQGHSFLDAAIGNLARVARSLRLGAPTGVLLLADPPGWDSIDALQSGLSGRADSRWRLEQLEEEIAFRATGPDGAVLALVKGHQIPTAERLEVLALCCRGELSAGAPLEDVVQGSLNLGGLTVVPWGFGKWFGTRGRQVVSYLENMDSKRFFVGDSGARLAGTPVPEVIHRAWDRGIRNLPGSDPFPFPSHQTRAGSRGFLIDGEIDPRRPASSLTALLSEQRAQPSTFGTGVNPLQFAVSQLRIHISRFIERGA